MLISIDETGQVLDQCMAEFVVRDQPSAKRQRPGAATIISGLIVGSGFTLLGVSDFGVGNDEVEASLNSVFGCT